MFKRLILDQPALNYLCAIAVLVGVIVSQAESRDARLRVALIGFTRVPAAERGQLASKAETVLNSSLGSDSRVFLVDQSLVQHALKGVGYDGSLNMSLDESRSLGGAIGCDFLVICKVEAFARSERAAEEHQMALIAVMIVDGRTGELAVFDFIDEKAATREAAVAAAIKTLESRAAGYPDRMSRRRLARAQIVSPAIDKNGEGRVEDIPDPDSAAAAGFTPPEFLNRVKPEYTSEAELGDITATVEAAVVFRSDGEIGEVSITRWAGFGLDEASIRAIRQLKFKPAMRDGQPISVRASVRYNFRRLGETPTTAAPDKLKDKPAPDLRKLFQPVFRPPSSQGGFFEV